MNSLQHSAYKKNYSDENKRKIIMNNDHKIFTGKAATRKRGRILSDLLENSTRAFIARTTIQDGMKGLDLNCGEGAITLHLADRVSDSGSITGVDGNLTNIDIARQKSIQKNRMNVRYFHRAEKSAYLNQYYDFVYARFLLSDCKNLLDQVEQMYQLLKPGGLLLVEDMDLTRHHCFPSSFAFTRYVELFSKVFNKKGTDPTVGSKLNSILKAAGFEQISAIQIPPIFLNEASKSISSLTLESISKAVIKEQLAVPAEMNALIEELQAFEQRTDTMISLPGIYQVQAKRI